MAFTLWVLTLLIVSVPMKLISNGHGKKGVNCDKYEKKNTKCVSKQTTGKLQFKNYCQGTLKNSFLNDDTINDK